MIQCTCIWYFALSDLCKKCIQVNAIAWSLYCKVCSLQSERVQGSSRPGLCQWCNYFTKCSTLETQSVIKYLVVEAGFFISELTVIHEQSGRFGKSHWLTVIVAQRNDNQISLLGKEQQGSRYFFLCEIVWNLRFCFAKPRTKCSAGIRWYIKTTNSYNAWICKSHIVPVVCKRSQKVSIKQPELPDLEGYIQP